MTTAHVPVLSAAERRRRLAVGLLRALAITVILGAGYYLAPLDRLSSVPMWLTLAIGLLALAVVAAIQVRAVIRSRYPALKAVEALAATAPLFLLLFAAAYFLVAQEDPSNFTVETLTRTDSPYFTVTIFATVGFGDISPASEAARILVMAQMILDLIVLGLGIRIFVGAIEVGRQKTSNGRKQPTAVSVPTSSLGADLVLGEDGATIAPSGAGQSTSNAPTHFEKLRADVPNGALRQAQGTSLAS